MTASNEALLRATLSALDEGIHMVDPRGVTIFYNRAAAALDGLEPEEVLGRHLLEVFPSLNDHSSTLLTVLQTRRPLLNQQQTLRNYKGDTITTINSTIPVLVDGELAGAVEISKDVTRVRELSEQVVDLQAELLGQKRSRGSARPAARYGFSDLVGQAPAFLAVLSRARRAAASDTAVLVVGETGTGKELLVHALHRASGRSGGPFIAQNCAALPGGLLEGLLFGTARGSFTGAEDRPGLFELADGGTLFLDEINSMSLDLQAKLLRVLQDGRVRRVGDSAERRLDVRVVASTNEDPLEAVEASRLRRDLFFRLNVVCLELPPLRNRPGDLELLVSHFLTRHGAGTAALDPAVWAVFKRYEWPGNVRELEHAIQGGLAVARDGLIRLSDLPPHLQRLNDQARVAAPVSTLRPGADLKESLQAAEREAVLAALAANGWNLSRTARALGVARQTLQYRIRILQLERPEATGSAE